MTGEIDGHVIKFFFTKPHVKFITIKYITTIAVHDNMRNYCFLFTYYAGMK